MFAATISSQTVTDLRSQLMGAGKPKVDLTDDTIPSRISYDPQTKKPRLSSERRLERERNAIKK